MARKTVSDVKSLNLLEILKSDFRFTSGIFLLVLVLQWLHLWFIRENPTFNVPIIDSLEYHEMARTLADPNLFLTQPYYHSPLYAWFMASLYAVFGFKLLAVRIVQSLMNAICCLLIYGVAHKLFSKTIARISALIWAFYGPVLFFFGEILNVSWILFFNLLTLWLVVRALEVPQLWRWLAAGLSLGLAAITRADILPFAGLISLWILWNSRKSEVLKYAFLQVTVFAAGVLSPLLLVGFINYSIAKQFTILPVNAGLNFYIGNNPNYENTIGIRPGATWEGLTGMPIREGIVSDTHDPENKKYFYGKAYHFIKSQPGKYLECLIYKIRTLLNGYELPETFDIYTYRIWSPILKATVWRIGSFGFPYGLLLPLAVCGIFMVRKDWKRVIPLVAMLVTYAFSLLFYWNSSRYRISLIPTLILLAAFALYEWSRTWKAGNESARGILKRSALPALFLIISLVLFNLPVQHFSQKMSFEAEMYASAGLRLVETGDAQLGISHMQRAVALDPENFGIRGNLAWSLSNQKRYDEAIAEYQKALAQNPDAAKLHNNYGVTLLHAGRTSEAISSYRRAITVDPTYADAHFSLGNAFYKLGRKEEAVQSYQNTVDLRPSHPDAYKMLAIILLELDRMDEASLYFNKAIEINPADAEFYFNLGNVYQRKNDAKMAIDMYTKAVQFDPGHFQALNNLGSFHYQQGKTDEAIQYYHRALASHPDTVLYTNLGIILLNRERYKEAMDCFQKALQLNPDNAKAQQLQKLAWEKYMNQK